MADPKRVVADWRHDLVFEGGAVGRPTVVLDGDAAAGPSPMEALLLALAACTGSDVVSILRKKRADLQGFRVEVVGERRDEHPRRYTAITVRYHVRAPALDPEHARRAIELSLERYCSVTHSIAGDIVVRHELLLDA